MRVCCSLSPPTHAAIKTATTEYFSFGFFCANRMNSSVITATCLRQSVVPLPYSLSPWRRGGGRGEEEERRGGGEKGEGEEEEEGEGEGERRRGYNIIRRMERTTQQLVFSFSTSCKFHIASDKHLHNP